MTHPIYDDLDCYRNTPPEIKKFFDQISFYDLAKEMAKNYYFQNEDFSCNRENGIYDDIVLIFTVLLNKYENFVRPKRRVGRPKARNFDKRFEQIYNRFFDETKKHVMLKTLQITEYEKSKTTIKFSVFVKKYAIWKVEYEKKLYGEILHYVYFVLRDAPTAETISQASIFFRETKGIIIPKKLEKKIMNKYNVDSAQAKKAEQQHARKMKRRTP